MLCLVISSTGINSCCHKVGNRHATQANLLIEHLTRRISASYVSIISCNFRFKRHLLTSLFNAIALPHILYISSFWKLLIIIDQTKICSIFFHFAEYLLRLPPWQSKSKTVRQFKISDPNIAVARVIA